MSELRQTRAALGRAGRRAMTHLIQAAIETLKAVEAVIDEMGHIGEDEGHHVTDNDRQRIEIE